jgi:hypothetical protein
VKKRILLKSIINQVDVYCKNLIKKMVVYSTSSCVIWAFFGMSGPRVPKKAQITRERVEYNVFLLDEPLKGPKSLKMLKNSLTFVLTSCQIYQNPFTEEKILKL